MFVRLSHYQQRSVRARVPELHATAMREHRTAYGKSQHEIELPPIAWRQILDTMRDQCFGPAGGRLDRGVPKSAYSAIKRIADAVMRIENHPAFHERAVEGWVGDVLLGWHLPGEVLGSLNPDYTLRTYFAYPRADMLAVMLGPIHMKVADREVTVWHPVNRPDYDAWSLRPETHLMFVGTQSSPSI